MRMRNRPMTQVMKHILVSTIVGSCLICGAYFAEAHESDKALQSLVSTEKPREVEGIAIQEKLGDRLDLETPVVDEEGHTVKLGTFFHPDRPVIFSLVYYSCPGLCNFHLNGLIEGLKKVDWTPGQQFETVALSFDPNEKSDLAAEKKKTYVATYGRPEAAAGMHFLTASPESIKHLTEQVGFKYRWDEQNKEWAHASAAIVVAPDGKITRYLHGIMFESKDLRLAISEGGQGKVGSILDQMVWYCFKYDPHKSKYVLYAFRLMQVCGALMVLLLAGILIPHWRREKQLTLERRNFG